MLSNETFAVGTLLDCTTSAGEHESFFHSTLWRQTVIGCNILQLLQDMYGFNVTYVIQGEVYELVNEINSYNYNSKSVDIYARPMSLRQDVIGLASPIQCIFTWNFGFILMKPENLDYGHFYGKPFTPRLWHSLYIISILICVLFFFLKRWENKIVTHANKWECSLSYEMLMVIGAYCQHIPPIDAVLYSRRAAYLTFFFFAFIVYSYYTSNLLSHLVNDKDGAMTLETLLDSDYECLILDNGMGVIVNSFMSNFASNTSMYQKLVSLKRSTFVDGLEAIRTSKTALLSDYFAITPLLSAVFTNEEICSLQKIDVFRNINKYLFVSKTFPYKEEFKIATLRAKETGVLSKLIASDFREPVCHILPRVQAYFVQILPPLALLFAVHIFSVIILLCEIIHYKKNFKPWPYAN